MALCTGRGECYYQAKFPLGFDLLAADGSHNGEEWLTHGALKNKRRWTTCKYSQAAAGIEAFNPPD